uniref:Uncharacterized protein n=1 Tax=Aegilops tauschii subsp. strangulata TaxID=200361 RepID=A0A453K9F4_AEGTS
DHYNFLFQIGNEQNMILLTCHVIYMYLFHKVHQCKYKFATHDDESRSERSLELTQVSYSHDQIRLQRQVFTRTWWWLDTMGDSVPRWLDVSY